MRSRRGLTVVVFATVAGMVALAAPTKGASVVPTVHFTAAGDYAATTATTTVLDKIAALQPDLHLALGDLSYGTTGAEQSWCDLVTSHVGAGFPFELISGNHESNGENGNINDFSSCLPNQLQGAVGTYGRQYYVDYPRQAPLVRFVMISPDLPFPDSTWSYSAGTPRYQWTSATIDGARTAGIPWVVVGMHKPCISVGLYACEPGADLMNLLVSKKVDLVLTGHEHGYERSKQLSLSASCPAVVPGTYNAGCVADGGNTLYKAQGTVFATVGTGGTALRDMNAADTEAPYFAAWSGLNTLPTHGLLEVTATVDQLSASFRGTSGAGFTDSFVINRGTPPNQSPIAAFTRSCPALTCAFDGSTSQDPDGTIASYAWDFGDGSVGTGVTAAHAYATAGTYTVSLTVTDNASASGVTTQTFAVTAPQTSYALDAFSRTLTSGWGNADLGGTWTLTGTVANFSVGLGGGALRLPAAGTGQSAYLTSVSSSDTEMAVTVTTDKPPTGGGTYVSVIGRRIVGAGDYRAKVRLQASGAVGVTLIRVGPTGLETVVKAEVIVVGLTYSAGDLLRVRVQATGLNPTTLRAKLWKSSGAEPAGWALVATDTTAGLQLAGHVGLMTYVSSTANNAPLTARYDDVQAGPAPAGP